MTTYSLEIDFNNPKKEGLPAPQIAQIFVKTHTSDDSGNIYITPQCMSFSEFEEQVTRLETELKELKRKAKRHFTR